MSTIHNFTGSVEELTRLSHSVISSEGIPPHLRATLPDLSSLLYPPRLPYFSLTWAGRYTIDTSWICQDQVTLHRLLARSNPPHAYPPHFRPQKGYLLADALPMRKGERPLVQGVAPQRQQTQKSDATVYSELIARIRATANDPRNQLLEGTSCFEKHSSGLFTSTPITRTCGGEICHAHASDGSMHMTLHPADAKLMLENGWGERHPLARGGWCRRFVPREFVMIYAPRDVAEVDVVMQLVAASVWWVSGIDIWNDGDHRSRGVDMAAVGQMMMKGGNECWAREVQACGGKAMEEITADA